MKISAIRTPQMVRLTKELETVTGMLRKGTIFTVIGINKTQVTAITGSGEHQLPIEHIEAI